MAKNQRNRTALLEEDAELLRSNPLTLGGETEASILWLLYYPGVLRRSLLSIVVCGRKCKPNLFQQEESLLASQTKHRSVVLVSGMARFWTQ